MLPTSTQKGHMYLVSFVLIFLLVLSTEARADLYGFAAITANSTIDPGIGEAQLTVNVTDEGGGQVRFTFSNAGPLASSITDIYFEDGTLLGIATIDNSDPGVSFSQYADPTNLPSANNANPPFVTTLGFSADSDPPAQLNGVNPTEQMGIVFDLESGKTFANVLTAIGLGFTNPVPGASLRIGIHVQGFADGDSESFIMTPIPASVILGILGLGAACLKLRRFT